MRVISGSLKGRRIIGYDIEGTRPTMDRVKESIFASIQNYVRDSVVLDLFAGSGNLGIEAISNGCKYSYFVDNNFECIKCIKNNISSFDIDNKCSVMYMDYNKALKQFREDNIKFDIIFIDPPYRYNTIPKIVNRIMEYNLVSDNGIIVLEYQINNIKDFDNLEIIKVKKYGDKYVSVLKKTID